jgi:hypothetical protein
LGKKGIETEFASDNSISAELDVEPAFFTASSRASLTSARFEVFTVTVGSVLPSKLGNTVVELGVRSWERVGDELMSCVMVERGS